MQLTGLEHEGFNNKVAILLY